MTARFHSASLFRLMGALLAGLVITPAQAGLAQQEPPPGPFTAATRTRVIEASIARLEQSYIEADTGRLIGEQLRRKLQSGAYDRFDNPAQFADAVTRDDGEIMNFIIDGVEKGDRVFYQVLVQRVNRARTDAGKPVLDESPGAQPTDADE